MKCRLVLQDLLCTCDAMDGLCGDGAIRSHVQLLREGLGCLQEEFLELQRENQRLLGQRESLETQVMNMASEKIHQFQDLVFIFDTESDDL